MPQNIRNGFRLHVWSYIDGDGIGQGEDGQAREEREGKQESGGEGGEREEGSRGEDGGMKEESGRREGKGDGKGEEGGEGKRDETRGGLQEWRRRKNEEDSGGPRYT